MRGCAIAGLAAAALLQAGCGGGHVDRSVLFSGQVRGPTRHAIVVSDRQAVRQHRTTERQWLSTIRAHAVKAPEEHFASPGSSVLRSRLARTAARYNLRVVSLRMRHPRQLAPEVVVESTDFVHAAKHLGAVIDAIDPAHPPHSNARVYEAIFVELVDERGIPYALAFDSLRGHIEGGQWARAEALYPFAHG
jgi:hypothetical protein